MKLFLAIFLITSTSLSIPVVDTFLSEITTNNQAFAIPGDTRPELFFTFNTGQLFTELYARYNVLSPAQINIFEPATYLTTTNTQDPGEAPAVARQAERLLTHYLKREGTYELYVAPNAGNLVFCPASGGTAVFVGLVYAIVMSDPTTQFLFVQKAPYFSRHRAAVTSFNYPNAAFQSFNDPSEINREGKVIVEYVTSVNNPDGSFRQPLANPDIIIADFVFSSPAYGPQGTGYVQENLAWLRQARASGKPVFSFDSASKHFGKAGVRWGYIWLDISQDYAAKIFPLFLNFLFSGGDVSTASGAVFLDLISALLARCDNGSAIFKDVNNSIIKRHYLVATELIQRYPGSQVTSIEGSPTLFARIVDPRSQALTAAQIVFQDTKAHVNNGTAYGADNSFVRINLTGPSVDLATFLNRLAGTQKYSCHQVIVSQAHNCTQKIIQGNSCKQVVYIATPNDHKLCVTTKKGPVTILLPPFINYENGPVITIEKTNKSGHSVTVKSLNFVSKLKKKGQCLKVQWTQPFFHNGRWKTVNAY